MRDVLYLFMNNLNFIIKLGKLVFKESTPPNSALSYYYVIFTMF